MDASAETMINLNDKNELYGVDDNGSRGNGMPSVSTDVVSEPYLVLKQIKEVRFDDFTVYAVNFQDKEYSWGKNAISFPKPVAGN